MDNLQRAVSHIAERAALDGDDAEVTFARIWNAAHAAADVESASMPRPKLIRPRPPRLTENWFC